MRALVTGCAGFIGSQLSDSLLRDGHEVLGIDCFNDNYGRAQKLANLDRAREWDSFDFVPLDLCRGALEDLVEGCEVIFHLAAEPGVRKSWGMRFDNYLRNNVLATQQLLEAVRGAQATRFVYASSASVYGDAESFPTNEAMLPRPFSPYGVTKLAGEHLCHSYHSNFGVPVVSLRYFSVYGPRQRPDMAFNLFCRAALRSQPIRVFGDGYQTRDFTFVEDIVRATRIAAEVPEAIGGVFNIGGGSQVSLRHTLGMIARLAGHRLDVTYAPTELGDVRDTAADTSEARRVLGFSAETDLEQGLQHEFDWIASQLGRPAV